MATALAFKWRDLRETAKTESLFLLNFLTTIYLLLESLATCVSIARIVAKTFHTIASNCPVHLERFGVPNESVVDMAAFALGFLSSLNK